MDAWPQNIDDKRLAGKIFRNKELEQSAEWRRIANDGRLDFHSGDFARTKQVCAFCIPQ